MNDEWWIMNGFHWILRSSHPFKFRKVTEMWLFCLGWDIKSEHFWNPLCNLNQFHQSISQRLLFVFLRGNRRPPWFRPETKSCGCQFSLSGFCMISESRDCPGPATAIFLLRHQIVLRSALHADRTEFGGVSIGYDKLVLESWSKIIKKPAHFWAGFLWIRFWPIKAEPKSYVHHLLRKEPAYELSDQ